MGTAPANNGATINSPCGAVLQDPGGTGDYGNSFNQSVTFCAPAGQYLMFTFNSFNTESGYDFLRFYDGTNTSAPLISALSGTTIPSPVYSSLGGCITVQFQSDGSVTAAGFNASISCTTVGPPQMPSCVGNPPAGNTCATATPICDLDGYCGNTSTSTYTSNSWSSSCGFLGLDDCGLTGEFCGSIENNSFLTYVASSSTISFNVWVFNSLYGDGIQLMVFTANNCSGNVTTYYCNGQMVPTGTGSFHTVTVSGLTPGNTYYIMIDGFAGDVCDYVIGAGSGISVPVQVDPSSITICPGETVPLTASGGNGTYTWNATPQLNTTSGANVIATPPATPGTYTYTVNSATGNPLCPSATNAIATVIVDNCGCTVNATNSGNVCPGGIANLFASNVSGASYSWTGPGGFTSTDQNPTGVVLPTTPGNYDYTVTANDGITTCTSTTTITVYALPNVSAGADQSVCTGSSVTLSGSGANTYTWTGGVSNGVSFVPAIGSNNYTVSGTDANGCVNTDQVTVTVNALPVVSAGTYSSVCQDAADVALSGTPSGGTFSGTGVTGNNFDPSFGTQTVTYSYTDANGCSNTANSTITVNVVPVADAGNNMSLCSGSNVVLNGSGIGTPTWSPSADLSSASVLNPTASPSSTTVYTLTIDNGFCTDSDQVTVTVTSSPNLTLTQNTSICVGDCIDLNVSGADFYSWEPAPGITDTTLQTQNVCPAVTTTYTVHGYTIGGSAMTNGDFEGGATGFNSDYTLNSNTQTEGTYFVTNNANLTHPGFTGLDHTTGSGNFLVVNGSSTPNSSVWCQTVAVQPNTNYVFSTWVSTLAVGSPAVLQFSINGVNISAPFTAPSVTGVWDEFYTTWNSGSQTTATICIVNQNTSLGGNDFGIDDIFFSAVCPTTETVTITVNEPANATITPVGPFCISGSAVTLQAAQTGGSWSGNGVNASTGSFNPAIAGAGTHNITYTIGGPCGDSDMIQIVVNPLPLADVGVDQEVCAGDAVTLTATGGTSYTWSNGVTNGVPFVPVATTVYTVTVTDANGCEETDNVTVTVHPLPTINGGPDVTVCEGTQVTLNGSGGASYLWNNGGTDGQPFTPAVGTTVFTVTGTDANGCVNTDNVNVTALPMPVADIEADINSGFPVLSVNFTNNSANANSYSWNFDNGQLNTVSSTSPQSTSYSEPGTYVVYMIADNGVCQVTDTVHIIVIPFPDPWIHIPNVFTPNGDGANDEFTIQTSYVAEMEIQIYNRWGEFMDEIIGTTDFWNGQFNGKDASDGTYFFKYYVKGINGKELTGHGNVTLIR